MTSRISIPQRARNRRQAGFSLIELMISMALGLLLLAAITSLIVTQSGHRDELEKTSRQIENGRYASQLLRDDIEHAGFYGQAFLLPNPPATLPDPCITAPISGSASLQEALPIAIQGYNSPAASPIACLPAADFVPGTDILVLRRAESDVTPLNKAITGDVFIQTSAASTVMATGAGASSSTFPLFLDQLKTVPAAIRKYSVLIYFISPCSNPTGAGTAPYNIPVCLSTDDDGHPIPTLMRLRLGAPSSTSAVTTWNLEPQVAGIENMQLDFGVDTSNDGYPNTYTMAPAAGDWVNVMAIRVNLLARNLECTPGYQDTKTYQLGLAPPTAPPPASAVGCTTGDYKRHVFTELVRAVNPSGRRASE